MKVLGIDTSGYSNAVGIIDGEQVLADFTFEAKTDSLEKIITNIDSTLKGANLTLDDIQGFGVGLGPGSWTGIRIGVTVGKILAYSTGKPVFGVPTLEVLAYSAGDKSALICSVISAGTKDTVYAAFYHPGNDTVSRAGEYYVGDIEGLFQTVKEPAVFIGSGVQLHDRLAKQAEAFPAINTEVIESTLRGSVVARLAAIHLERDESNDVLSLTPLYLKESTARAFLGRYSGSAHAKD